MNIPGFTASASLDRTNRSFHETARCPTQPNGVIPQTKSCVATIDGGQWCCINNTNPPVCYKVEPSPIITALTRRIAAFQRRF
jgi:hypothetical protein